MELSGIVLESPDARELARFYQPRTTSACTSIPPAIRSAFS